jgi:hypothetical protein
MDGVVHNGAAGHEHINQLTRTPSLHKACAISMCATEMSACETPLVLALLQVQVAGPVGLAIAPLFLLLSDSAVSPPTT